MLIDRPIPLPGFENLAQYSRLRGGVLSDCQVIFPNGVLAHGDGQAARLMNPRRARRSSPIAGWRAPV